MKTNTFSKVLALLLALIMIVCMVPVSFAEDTATGDGTTGETGDGTTTETPEDPETTTELDYKFFGAENLSGSGFQFVNYTTSYLTYPEDANGDLVKDPNDPEKYIKYDKNNPDHQGVQRYKEKRNYKEADKVSVIHKESPISAEHPAHISWSVPELDSKYEYRAEDGSRTTITLGNRDTIYGNDNSADYPWVRIGYWTDKVTSSLDLNIQNNKDIRAWYAGSQIAFNPSSEWTYTIANLDCGWGSGSKSGMLAEANNNKDDMWEYWFGNGIEGRDYQLKDIQMRPFGRSGSTITIDPAEFKIRYIAFFKSEEDAINFIEPDIVKLRTVTIKKDNENGEIAYQGIHKPGDIITLSELELAQADTGYYYNSFSNGTDDITEMTVPNEDITVYIKQKASPTLTVKETDADGDTVYTGFHTPNEVINLDDLELSDAGTNYYYTGFSDGTTEITQITMPDENTTIYVGCAKATPIAISSAFSEKTTIDPGSYFTHEEIMNDHDSIYPYYARFNYTYKGGSPYFQYKFAEDMFPESANNAYMKVAVRTNIDNNSQIDFNIEANGTNFNLEPCIEKWAGAGAGSYYCIAGEHPATLWGQYAKPAFKSDEQWQEIIVNMSAFDGGNASSLGVIPKDVMTRWATDYNIPADLQTKYVDSDNTEYYGPSYVYANVSEDTVLTYIKSLDFKVYCNSGEKTTNENGVVTNPGGDVGTDYFDVAYIAFFDDLESAQMYTYEYEDAAFLNISKDGQQIAKIPAKEGDTYTLAEIKEYSELTDMPGYALVFKDAEGNYIKDEGVTISATTEITAEYVAPAIVLDYNNLDNANVTSTHVGGSDKYLSWTAEFEDNRGYFRLKANFGKEAQDGNSNDGIRLDINLSNDDKNIVDIIKNRYILVKYRSDNTVKSSSNIAPIATYTNTSGTTKTDRVWADKDQLPLSVGEWRTAIIQNQSGGGNNGTIDTTQPATLTGFNIRLGYNQMTNITEGDYLDIEYIAYFDSEAAAKAYVYAPDYTLYGVNVTVSETDIPEGTVTATVNGTAKSSTTFGAYENDTVVLTATDAEGYRFDGWYDNNTGYLLEANAIYEVALTENIDVNANYIKNEVDTAAMLVVSNDKDGHSSVTINGVTEDSYSQYHAGNVDISAEADEGYKFAYWMRDTQGLTQIFLGVKDEITVTPLGTLVAYMPVTVDAATEAVSLYIYKDTGRIIGVDTEPEYPVRIGYEFKGWDKQEPITSSDGVEVNIYYPIYVKDSTATAIEMDISYVIGDSVSTTVQYNSTTVLTATVDDPIWTYQYEGEDPVVFSESKTAYFVYSNTEFKKVTITETAGGSNNLIIKITDTYYDSDASKAAFVAIFDLPEGAKRVEHGILLASGTGVDKDFANTMTINTQGIIVGKVKLAANEEASTCFIINKANVTSLDDAQTWYGRPYITYTYEVGGQTVTTTAYGDAVQNSAPAVETTPAE